MEVRLTENLQEYKKNYREVAAPYGRVLMPPYRLEIEPVVTFRLKSFLFIKWIRQEGISL